MCNPKQRTIQLGAAFSCVIFLVYSDHAPSIRLKSDAPNQC